MERNSIIPPNFVTLRDLKERREREQMLKLQQSIQVEKEEGSEVKQPLIAPVHRKENGEVKRPLIATMHRKKEGEVKRTLIATVHRKEEKEEGSLDNFPPKYLKLKNQNRGRGRGPPPKHCAIVGAQAADKGSTSNADKKKKSSAEVAGVITEMSLTGLSYASEGGTGEKRTKATTALVNGGKTGHVALDIERRISSLRINGRNSNYKRGGKGIGGGRGYGNNGQKSSSTVGMVWIVKKPLNQKDEVAGSK